MFQVAVTASNPRDPTRRFAELYLPGATALENFGVQADPTTRQLRPIAAVIGGFPGSALGDGTSRR